MSYCIPLEVKVFPNDACSFKDFIKEQNIRNDTMIFLSENCYAWLKNNSIYIEQQVTKVFRQQDKHDDTKAYIETINIVSSNCSFLKNIFSNDYVYEYSNGIPKKVLIIMMENEQKDFKNDISVSVIEPDEAENPVDCIINNPNLFEDSIVFLNSKSHQKLKRNTNTISNLYCLERLIWTPDDRYPGGDIMLHRLNYESLYMICDMNFPFFTKRFRFSKVPKAIYFIS